MEDNSMSALNQNGFGEEHKLDYRSDDGRWEAVVGRDQKAVGVFVYAVATTGIYCRPGCASRLPNRENVRFFETALHAEQAGFRPCKRCTPNLENESNASQQIIIKACQIIERAVQVPTLPQLAHQVGLSPYHFHRLFKKVTGITPKQYMVQKRMERARSKIQQDESITKAVYEAGFDSSSRFYETAVSSLGMTPSEFRDGGAEVTIWYAIEKSYLGYVLVAATERGICQIDFGDSVEVVQARLEKNFPRAEFLVDDPGFKATVAEVLSFLDHPEEGFNLPMDVQGTVFQRQVWDALQKIPAGSTASYTDIAAHIGKPKAVRAVARACAANRIAVAIPCHRVVRSDGTLGGYRWGIDRKRAVLRREADTQG